MAKCACGRPLHYTIPAIQIAVQKLVDDLGEEILVTAPSGNYMVSRHYIALHGITTEELPLLAAAKVIRRVK